MLLLLLSCGRKGSSHFVELVVGLAIIFIDRFNYCQETKTNLSLLIYKASDVGPGGGSEFSERSGILN